MKSAIILIALGFVCVVLCKRTPESRGGEGGDRHPSHSSHGRRLSRDVKDFGNGVYRSSAEGSNAPSLNQAPGVTYVSAGGGNGPSLITDDQGHVIATNGALKLIV